MPKKSVKLTISEVNSPNRGKYLLPELEEETSEYERDEVKTDTIKEEKMCNGESSNEDTGRKTEELCVYGDVGINTENMYPSNLYDRGLGNNLAEKVSMLKTLQLDKLKKELEGLKKKSTEDKPRKRIPKLESSPYPIRTRNKGAGAKELCKMPSVVPLRRLSPRIIKQERKSMDEKSLIDQTVTEVKTDKYPRKPEGPLKMSDVIQDLENEEEWENHLKELGSYIARRRKEEKKVETKGKSWTSAIDVYKSAERHWDFPKNSISLDGFKEQASKLTMWCGSLARVLRERIASLAVHPSKDRLIIAAGGKNGSLGLWVVSPSLSYENGRANKEAASASASGVYMFQPHSGQVNCASFCAFGGDRLITTSYDGTVRVLDLEKLVFNQLYASPLDLRNSWMQWHCQISPNVLLTSQGSGNVFVLDERSHREHEAVLKCYERSCRTVSIHPLHPMYLATCSSIGYSSIWDLRKFGSKSSKKDDRAVTLKGVLSKEAAICHLGTNSRTLSSAFFSPVTGSGLLTTSSDDYIRIYDTSKLVEGVPYSSLYRVETGIKHNNKTGMWLTTFKATWHPRRDDAFVVGSLAQPRQVEVYGRHGRLLTTVGKVGPLPINTVCPVNAFHPNRFLLASADSGGRVHLFL